MILVDSNVPMHIVGADHPHKRSPSDVLHERAGSLNRMEYPVGTARFVNPTCHTLQNILTRTIGTGKTPSCCSRMHVGRVPIRCTGSAPNAA